MALRSAAAQRRRRAYSPWTKPTLPPGSYDPNLDSQLRAAQRGYQNLTGISPTTNQLVDPSADLPRQARQALVQEAWNVGDYERNREEARANVGRQTEQLNRSYGRNLADLLTQRQHTGEDYQRNLSGLERQFGMLKSNQEQAASRAGLSRGGALAQALAKRTANKAWERAPIDTSYNRAAAASRLGEARLGEDYQTNLAGIERSRQGIEDDTERGLARLLAQGEWATEERGVQAGRATENLSEYASDVTAAKLAAAKGQLTAAEWNRMTKPANEFRSPSGQPFRVVMVGGQKRYLLPNGSLRTVRPR